MAKFQKKNPGNPPINIPVDDEDAGFNANASDDPAHEEEGVDTSQEHQGAAVKTEVIGKALPPKAAAKPAAKALPPAPVNTKAPISKKTRQEMLDAIRRESERRVDYDNFLHDEDRQGNKYDIPAHLIPDGFTIEMKTTHVMGQAVPDSEIAAHQMAGWQNCPAELLAEMLPEGYDKPFYERDGMIAMIRPSIITERFRRKEHLNAQAAVRNKVNELENTKEGTMDRVVKTHRHSLEAIQVDDRKE